MLETNKVINTIMAGLIVGVTAGCACSNDKDEELLQQQEQAQQQGVAQPGAAGQPVIINNTTGGHGGGDNGFINGFAGAAAANMLMNSGSRNTTHTVVHDSRPAVRPVTTTPRSYGGFGFRSSSFGG